MSWSSQACFGYRIRPESGGWTWEAYDLSGEVQAQGWAPQKALAAACVIRALACASAEGASQRAA